VPRDKEPQEQLPAEIQEFQAGFKTSFDYILRFTLSDPKTTIQVVGSEIVDFERTDLIELRDPAKNRIVFYINRSTKLPIKMQVGDRMKKSFAKNVTATGTVFRES
jgi:hypothetical protein